MDDKTFTVKPSGETKNSSKNREFKKSDGKWAKGKSKGNDFELEITGNSK